MRRRRAPLQEPAPEVVLAAVRLLEPAARPLPLQAAPVPTAPHPFPAVLARGVQGAEVPHDQRLDEQHGERRDQRRLGSPRQLASTRVAADHRRTAAPTPRVKQAAVWSGPVSAKWQQRVVSAPLLLRLRDGAAAGEQEG